MWKDHPKAMKGVRQYFELKLREEELAELNRAASNEPEDFITRKEFRYAIGRLENVFKEAIYQDDFKDSESIVYPAESTTDTGYDNAQENLIIV